MSQTSVIEEITKEEEKLFSEAREERERSHPEPTLRLKNCDRPEKKEGAERMEERTKRKSSQKGRRTDALAHGAEERRDKLRKAAGSGKCTVIRRCLNGETRPRIPRSPCTE